MNSRADKMIKLPILVLLALMIFMPAKKCNYYSVNMGCTPASDNYLLFVPFGGASLRSVWSRLLWVLLLTFSAFFGVISFIGISASFLGDEFHPILTLSFMATCLISGAVFAFGAHRLSIRRKLNTRKP